MVQQRRELKFGLDPSCERERQPTGSDLPRFRLPCAGQVGWLDVPLGCIPSLPRTPRRVQLPLCSPGSTVLWTHLTSGRYSWQACPLGGSLPAASVGPDDGRGTSDRSDLPGKRVLDIECMHRVSDSAASTMLSPDDEHRDVAFPRARDKVGRAKLRPYPMIAGELNGWPALPPKRTLRTDRLPDPHLRWRRQVAG